MLDSSVWVGTGLEVKVLWMTMLLMADKDGKVEAALPGLAHRATLSLDQTIRALEVLTSPDPHSKSLEAEGRRAVKVDGGWQVVNYAKYRDKWVGAQKAMSQATKQKAYRLRVAAGLPPKKRGRPPLHRPDPLASVPPGYEKYVNEPVTF